MMGECIALSPALELGVVLIAAVAIVAFLLGLINLFVSR
jgi:hypothetical protein